VGGHLLVRPSGAADGGLPGEMALIAGVELAGFDLDLYAGRVGPAGAAIIFGHESEASYHFLTLEPGQAVTLTRASSTVTGQVAPSAVSGCSGETLTDRELPDGDVAELHVSARDGEMLVYGGPDLLLRCSASPARGRIGLGALHGTVSYDNVVITR
jgi:hypothetical protein